MFGGFGRRALLGGLVGGGIGALIDKGDNTSGSVGTGALIGAGLMMGRHALLEGKNLMKEGLAGKSASTWLKRGYVKGVNFAKNIPSGIRGGYNNITSTAASNVNGTLGGILGISGQRVLGSALKGTGIGAASGMAYGMVDGLWGGDTGVFVGAIKGAIAGTALGAIGGGFSRTRALNKIERAKNYTRRIHVDPAEVIRRNTRGGIPTKNAISRATNKSMNPKIRSQMATHYAMESHSAREAYKAARANEATNRLIMINNGYRQTSTGWVKKY